MTSERQTPPDGIEFDYRLEQPVTEAGSDAKTPVPRVSDPCPGCKLKPLARVKNDVPAPGSLAEAKRYTSCVSPNHGLWYLCVAGPFLGVPGAGVKVYLGPERRVGLPPLPPPSSDRRRPVVPPREDDR